MSFSFRLLVCDAKRIETKKQDFAKVELKVERVELDQLNVETLRRTAWLRGLGLGKLLTSQDPFTGSANAMICRGQGESFEAPCGAN